MGSEALAYALRLLARKGYSRAALRAKLAARFGEAEAEAALGRLEAMGYLDDRAYARAFVETRARRYGPRKLRALLLARGVPEEVVEEPLAILRRYRHRDAQARAVRFLEGRGFPLGVALEAWRLAQEEGEGYK
mgnify:CR=1 FL=1